MAKVVIVEAINPAEESRGAKGVKLVRGIPAELGKHVLKICEDI